MRRKAVLTVKIRGLDAKPYAGQAVVTHVQFSSFVNVNPLDHDRDWFEQKRALSQSTRTCNT